MVWSFQKIASWLIILFALILVIIIVLGRANIIKQSIAKILNIG